MLDHLESVLANESVAVKSGQFIVEVKPQGVSKGLVTEKIFTSMAESGRQTDFVLCVGDDRSDEDMFEVIGNAMNNGVLSSKHQFLLVLLDRNQVKPSTIWMIQLRQ
ncbi:hypothetical protein F0562_018153 [Nyssa sinensis]|uniref:Trehalose 6-phosphate phosphatase n=1 Tax=Nyssa sinensis TaxID=561372 RepID=A0A5J4Z9H0_9ASTE|nr:hypothetical protein F0562_018153 [Nyssa sinensis]